MIGSYRLVGVIGSGGMGRVFLGVAPDGRLAAVKQVLAGIAEDPGFRTRFAREVDASRKVSGAYTAPILDADPHARVPWLASLYVPGPSLQQAVTTHGPLPETTLRRLAVGLLTALAEIHRAGLIHRDFKPGNVLLTDDGPRVIDFGIAHAVHDALHDAAPLTQAGAIIGSPSYMSPEQLDERPLTPASDVFALGAVLAYSAGGSAPFGRGNPQSVLYRVAIGEPDLSRVAPNLRPLIASCLIKQPAQRPTVPQLLAAIGRIEPAHLWLPPALHHEVIEQTNQARHLAGLVAPPTSTDLPSTGHQHRGHRHYGPAHPQPTSFAPTAPRPGGGTHPKTGHLALASTDAGRARRRNWRVAAAIAVVIAAVTTVVVLLPRDTTDPGTPAGTTGGDAPVELSAQDAAALVTQLVPDPDNPPAGFRIDDEPSTPEIDGAPNDPLVIDRSRTYLACEVQADPPTPAEAGTLAVSTITFRENVGELPDRFRNYLFITVAYLDTANRTQIMREVRGRIADCRTDIPPDFTAWRFTDNTITGADEAVGYIANQSPDVNFPDFNTRVGACDFARADAIIIRGCALLTNNAATPGYDPTISQDDTLRATTRNLIEPLVLRARELQRP